MLSIDDYYLCKHELQEVIRSFKPDIIQVFGIEQGLASVVELTDIPVVLHLQGLIIPYLNAFSLQILISIQMSFMAISLMNVL